MLAQLASRLDAKHERIVKVAQSLRGQAEVAFLFMRDISMCC